MEPKIGSKKMILLTEKKKQITAGSRSNSICFWKGQNNVDKQSIFFSLYSFSATKIKNYKHHKKFFWKQTYFSNYNLDIIHSFYLICYAHTLKIHELCQKNVTS